MLDWRVQINGRDPDGWDPRRDGCYFPDFDHQEYLLPFFDVGDTPLDPYDGCEFLEGDLRRLRTHLRCYRAGFEARPTTWSITETLDAQSHTIHLERDKILNVIDRTLQMIDFALSHGGTLMFRGD